METQDTAPTANEAPSKSCKSGSSTTKQRKPSKSLPITITAAELSHKDIPPLHWVVRGFLPEGVTIIAGPPKAGKSWLGLQLALAAATGTDFAGIGSPP